MARSKLAELFLGMGLLSLGYLAIQNDKQGELLADLQDALADGRIDAFVLDKGQPAISLVNPAPEDEAKLAELIKQAKDFRDPSQIRLVDRATGMPICEISLRTRKIEQVMNQNVSLPEASGYSPEALAKLAKVCGIESDDLKVQLHIQSSLSEYLERLADEVPPRVQVSHPAHEEATSVRAPEEGRTAR